MAAIKGNNTLIELAQEFDLHPNQIKQWRDQLLEGATGVFGQAPKADPERKIKVTTLHAKIGQLTLENDLHERNSVKGRVANRSPAGSQATWRSGIGGLTGSCWACDPGRINYIRQLHDG